MSHPLTKHHTHALQLAVRAILAQAQQYKWSVQGMGMLRLFIEDVERVVRRVREKHL